MQKNLIRERASGIVYQQKGERKILTPPNSPLVGCEDKQELANKRIDGDKNTVINLPGSAIKDNEVIISKDFELAVSLGLVPGYVGDTKFGRVKLVDGADTPLDIWAMADDTASPKSATKTFPTTAQEIFVASSSNSDTSAIVSLSYIDALGVGREVEDLALNGQTPVSIGDNGLDVNRLFVSGDTASLGDIYAIVGNDFTSGVPNDVTDILAFSPVDSQQTQQSHRTVPLGKVLVMTGVYIPVSRASGAAGSANVQLKVKEWGKIPRVRREFYPTTEDAVTRGVEGLVVPARGQICWEVYEISDNDTNISCVWKYLLADV